MKKLAYFLPAILFYLLIFSLSSRDWGIRLDRHHLDKVTHIIEFAIMTFLLALGFFSVLKASLRSKILVTFFLGLALAFLDEYHQHFVPGRHMDFLDGLADALGAACGILLYLYFEKKRKPAVKV
jgi:VanZ family protein